MKVAMLQTDSGRDREENIAILADLGEQAKSADLIITPECTNLKGYWPSEDELFTTEDEPVVNMAKRWARDHKVPMILGSVLVQDEKRGGAVNRQLFIDQSGEIIAHYDKINMFDVDLPNGESFRESDRFVAGEEAVITPFGDINIGHSICFDLRFPLLYRALAQKGANVLIIPSAFTKFTGRAHWRSLMRARAIENGAYVLAPAQCGSYVHYDGSTRDNWGHSIAVSPWGEVICELDEAPDVAIVDVQIERVKSAREEIPSYKTDRAFTFKSHDK